MSKLLLDIVRRNRREGSGGIASVCSANPWVLEAAARHAVERESPLLVESTSNQVNQFGGYTGQKPAEFAAAVYAITDAAGLPREHVVLGGDHLGPYPWRGEPAETAISKACELVRRCVQAGYRKIHLDASMRCGDDPAGALAESTIAARSALLCEAAERAGGNPPLYVVGTEVPVPGGEQAAGEPPSVTTPEDARRTLEHTRQAFVARGLEAAWERVIGLVVQPGVEFGDAVVFGYDRAKAGMLSQSLPAQPELVYEAHSTDYQTARALREMVEDHFAILKVGPWLTFAFREAVFVLAAIEREWRGEHSRVPEALEAAMLANPVHWKAYYQGGERELSFARRYSFSDRSRYYWPEPSVRAELDRLVANLTAAPPPLTLLSQYLPAQYEAVREGTLENHPGALLRHRVRGVLETYWAACR